MSDQVLGEIRIFAGNYAPQDWAACDGRSLPIQGNEALFSLLGTTYGGDGVNQFNLPDLRGRLPLSQGGSALSGTNYTLGQHGGCEAVTLSAEQMPAHSHSVQASSAAATTGTAKGNYLAKATNASGGTNQDVFYLQANAPVKHAYVLNQSSVSPAGGDQAHSNIMPSEGANFIIALAGSYPSFQ